MTARGPVAATFAIGVLAAITWLLLPSEGTPSQAAPTAAAVEPAVQTAELPAPQKRAAVGQGAVAVGDMLGAPPPGKLSGDAAPGHGGVLKGQLAVRQRPQVTLGGLEVMVTRTWLDTVVPIEVGDPAEPLPELEGVRTTTDEKGNFVLSVTAEADEMFLLVGRGSEWHEVRMVPYVPRAGEVLDLGVLWFDDRGSIVGRVNAHGRPCSGIDVRAVDAPLVDTSVDSEDLRAARNAGLACFRVDGFVNGQPLPRWIVQRDRLLPFPRARTDADGTFVVRGVRPGNHELFLAGGDLNGSTRDVIVRGGERTDVGRIDLRLGTGVNLEVVDENNRPWAGARVAAMADGFAYAPPPLMVTANGTVVLSGLPPAPGYTVLFQLPNGGPWQRIGAVEADADANTRLTVFRPRLYEFNVVDAEGKPVPAPTARAFLLQPPEQQAKALRPTDSALPQALQPQLIAPGRMRIALFPSALAVVSAAGAAPAVVSLPTPDDTVMLPVAVPVRVRTIDRDGVPVAGARIVAHLQPLPNDRSRMLQYQFLASPRALLGRTDERGELRVPALPPALVTIAAEHPDYARAMAASGMPTRDQEFVLSMRRATVLHGRVTMDHRAVGAGYRGEAVNGWPAGQPLADNPFLTRRVALTDASGSFTMHDLPPSLWIVRALLPKESPDADRRLEAERYQPTLVQLDDGQTQWIDVEATRPLGARPRLVGQLTEDGVGVDHALVRVRPALRDNVNMQFRRARSERARRNLFAMFNPERMRADPWSQRAFTDAQGAFAFEDLADGDWEVRVDVLWQGTYCFLEQRLVTIGRDQLHDCTNLPIELRTGTAQLWFVNAAAQLLPGVVVRLRQLTADGSEAAVFQCLTDARGGVLADNIPAGTWAVELVHGAPLRSAELVVKARDMVAVTFSAVR
jgi:hypothetical protein